MTLAEIQSLLKVPKTNRNTFGNYNYRSAEDILEAVKAIINPAGLSIILSDEIVEIGGRNYVKATATIAGVGFAYGFAREEETKKGMDAAQITGSASSYARKYALNGLLAIDDTKDPDATNKHETEPVKPTTAPKETKLLPAITEAQFDKALDYVTTKEQYGFVCAKYIMTPRQDELLFNQILK